MLFRLTAAFFLLFSFVRAVSPQTQSIPPKANGELITLTVTVKNKSGNLVMGLSRDLFQLSDEKEARTIEAFENADSPMSIGLLVDTSASMQFYENKDIARAQAIGEALSSLVELSNPKSEFFVLAFDSVTRVLIDWKFGEELAREKITLSPVKRDTALYDAVSMGMDKFASAHYQKRALVLFTDGQDSASKATFTQLRDRLRRSDVLVYAVGIATPADVGSALGMEGEGILAELAEVTGGAALFPHDKKQMRSAVEATAAECRHQYRITFRATNSKPGWHKLKVTIAPRTDAPPEFRSLTARTRQAYYVTK